MKQLKCILFKKIHFLFFFESCKPGKGFFKFYFGLHYSSKDKISKKIVSEEKFNQSNFKLCQMLNLPIKKKSNDLSPECLIPSLKNEKKIFSPFLSDC